MTKDIAYLIRYSGQLTDVILAVVLKMEKQQAALKWLVFVPQKKPQTLPKQPPQKSPGPKNKISFHNVC